MGLFPLLIIDYFWFKVLSPIGTTSYLSVCLNFVHTVEHPKPRFLLWWQKILEMNSIHMFLSKHIFVGGEGKGDWKTPRLRIFIAVTRNSSKLLNCFSCYQVFTVPWKVCGREGVIFNTLVTGEQVRYYKLGPVCMYTPTLQGLLETGEVNWKLYFI